MTTWLADSAHIFVYTAAALLPVANPVGMSAPFYAMTRHLENHERKALARRVATYFFVVVVATVLFGCVFQTKAATESRGSLPPIPRESCH